MRPLLRDFAAVALMAACSGRGAAIPPEAVTAVLARADIFDRCADLATYAPSDWDDQVDRARRGARPQSSRLWRPDNGGGCYAAQMALLRMEGAELTLVVVTETRGPLPLARAWTVGVRCDKGRCEVVKVTPRGTS
jgi:hypothetical protein